MSILINLYIPCHKDHWKNYLAFILFFYIGKCKPFYLNKWKKLSLRYLNLHLWFILYTFTIEWLWYSFIATITTKVLSFSSLITDSKIYLHWYTKNHEVAVYKGNGKLCHSILMSLNYPCKLYSDRSVWSPVGQLVAR